jgi:hypothetical protein
VSEELLSRDDFTHGPAPRPAKSIRRPPSGCRE